MTTTPATTSSSCPASCPTAKRDVMVSKQTAASAHLKVGSKLRLLIGASLKGLPAQVVGIYDADGAEARHLGPGRPAAGSGPAKPQRPPAHRRDRHDRRADARRRTPRSTSWWTGHWSLTTSTRPTQRSSGRGSSNWRRTRRARPGSASAPNIPLLGLLDSLAHERSLVRTAAFAVTAQLVLLAWFVLFVIVGSTMDERSSEIAMAKLRGLKPRSTGAFALSETRLLLTAALPLGLVLGWAVNAALTDRVLAPGTEFSAEPKCLRGARRRLGGRRGRRIRRHASYPARPGPRADAPGVGSTCSACPLHLRRDDGGRPGHRWRVRAAQGRIGHARSADAGSDRARSRPALRTDSPAAGTSGRRDDASITAHRVLPCRTVRSRAGPRASGW